MCLTVLLFKRPDTVATTVTSATNTPATAAAQTTQSGNADKAPSPIVITDTPPSDEGSASSTSVSLTATILIIDLILPKRQGSLGNVGIIDLYSQIVKPINTALRQVTMRGIACTIERMLVVRLTEVDEVDPSSLGGVSVMTMGEGALSALPD